MGVPHVTSLYVAERRFRFDHNFESPNNELMESADPRPSLPQLSGKSFAKMSEIRQLP